MASLRALGSTSQWVEPSCALRQRAAAAGRAQARPCMLKLGMLHAPDMLYCFNLFAWLTLAEEWSPLLVGFHLLGAMWRPGVLSDSKSMRVVSIHSF